MKKHKEVIIYYFSGTGNAKNVARWFNESAKDRQIKTTIIDISKIDRLNIKPAAVGTLVIFISPIHGFNYPPIMLHFILRFPKGANSVVLMNTRAGMRINKFITPGVTGIAFYLSSIILILKGYSLIAYFPVDLPSNWISIHPGLNDKAIKYIHYKIKRKVIKFSDSILAGETNFKAMWEVYDIFLLPISLSYYLVGRFVFSKTFYASKDCNNCKLCITACPVRAIKMIENRPFWTLNCESCMKCMSICPQKAIETAHGSTIGLTILFTSVFISYFHFSFNRYVLDINNKLLTFILDSILFVGVLVIWYRLFHFLMRFRFFERIMVYTSLTKYKFWGRRYKAIKD